MEFDRIFYASWGFILIIVGLCAIIGMFLELSLLAIIILWFLFIGFLLVIIGSLNQIKNGKNNPFIILLGLVIVVGSAVILTVLLELINIYIAISIIIIIAGVSTVLHGFSKNR
jgi:hypothetical protein